jgi:hypothetical protein
MVLASSAVSIQSAQPGPACQRLRLAIARYNTVSSFSCFLKIAGFVYILQSSYLSNRLSKCKVLYMKIDEKHEEHEYAIHMPGCILNHVEP